MSFFHERLKLAIKEAKMSQRKLAIAIGVKPQSLWEWCNITYPSVDRLIDICRTLKVSPSYLLGFED